MSDGENLNLLLLMPLQRRLLDEVLVAFVALEGEGDAVLELLVVESPAAGFEGGATDLAQGSPLFGLQVMRKLGLISSGGGVFWHPGILRP